MPIYEFKCDKCKSTFEQLTKENKNDSTCPVCGNQSQKIISISTFRIKGYNAKNGYSKTE
jgi:putative FmdB family regulatory protein